MAKELKQFVVQLKSALNGKKRILIQSWEGNFSPNIDQKIIEYDKLTPKEKAKWDAFEDMIKSKK